MDSLPGKANGTTWQNRIVRYELIAPDQLLANPFNWRIHRQIQQQHVEELLNRVGWVDVIKANVRTQHVVDGHLRVTLAMRHNEPTVPVLWVDLTEEEERAVLATLDWITGEAGTDTDILGGLLEGIEQDGLFELDEGLFKDLVLDLDLHLGDEPPIDPGAQIDKAAELQEKWQVKQGDVWQAGAHFVICGDCREPATWERLLGTAGVGKVNGVFTSPPYAEQRKEQYGGVPVDEYVDWWGIVQANVRAHLARDGSFFVNIKPHCEDGERVLYVFDLVLAMKRRWGWRFEDEFSWYHSGTPKRVQRKFKNAFEPVYHFSLGYDFRFNPESVRHYSSSVPVWDAEKGIKGAKKASLEQGKGTGFYSGIESGGLAYPSNVITARATESKGHQAAFPVALPDFFVRAYSDPGDAWIDPFLGSGTTIVAAHQNDRVGLGCELLEKYIAVTLERLAGMELEPRLSE